MQQIVTFKTTNAQNFTYTYTSNGNATAALDGVYTGSASATIGNIQYDDLDRVTSLTNTSGAFNYAYSSIGNIITNKEFGTGAYSYGTLRPHFVRSANGAWYTADLNGNVVFRSGQRLDYNPDNQLNRVVATNGLLTAFGYSASGERLWKSNSTNTLQVWIGANYEEKNGQVLYHITAAGRLICTFDKTGTAVFEYYHPDNLTSTSVQTDQNGNQLQHYSYTAFGQTRYTQSGSAFPPSRRYTGQIFDEDTGLCFYNARYYDPQLARFLQPDDIIPEISNPQSWNRYAYCLNNPLRYTDPSGKDVLGAVGNFAGGTVIGAANVINPVPAQLRPSVPPPSSTAEAYGRRFGENELDTPANAEAMSRVFALAQLLGLRTLSSEESSTYVSPNTPMPCPPRGTVPVPQGSGFASLFQLSTPSSSSVRDATRTYRASKNFLNYFRSCR